VNAVNAIPVTIVTGFLGAGKTSLLNTLLRAREVAATLVLINEWGDIGLDHLLIEKIDGDMILLNSGCVCCTLRGDLVDCLRDCLARRDAGAMAPFERIVIETTGLADPSPILQAILGDPRMSRRLRLAGMVTLIDAINGEATLARHRVSAGQIALADVLAIAKSDLVDPARAVELANLRERLRALNPVARTLPLANSAPPSFSRWSSMPSQAKARRAPPRIRSRCTTHGSERARCAWRSRSNPPRWRLFSGRSASWPAPDCCG
jgi:G3E family GTPase